jgi:Domain of unknown function (DUF3331)
MLAKNSDPWSQSIALLEMLSGTNRRAAASIPMGDRAASRAPPIGRPPRNAKVRVLDRPSPSTVTVAWLDPTSCRYGNQVWRLGVAHGAGTCAISAWQIRPGASVYKPRACRPMPANADAMILASVVDDALEPRARFAS